MNSDRYSFRLSGRPAKILEDEIKKQQVTPSAFIRAVVIEHLEHEESANQLHREIENQLSGLFRALREENNKFRDVMQADLASFKSDLSAAMVADLKENRTRLGEGIKSLFDAANQLIARMDEAGRPSSSGQPASIKPPGPQPENT